MSKKIKKGRMRLEDFNVGLGMRYIPLSMQHNSENPLCKFGSRFITDFTYEKCGFYKNFLLPDQFNIHDSSVTGETNWVVFHSSDSQKTVNNLQKVAFAGAKFPMWVEEILRVDVVLRAKAERSFLDSFQVSEELICGVYNIVDRELGLKLEVLKEMVNMRLRDYSNQIDESMERDSFWDEVIKEFGTHIVKGVLVGGVRVLTIERRKVAQLRTDEKIAEAIAKAHALSFGGEFSAKLKGSERKNSSEDKTKMGFSASGGSTISSNLDEWFGSMKENPKVLRSCYSDISNYLENEEHKKKFQAARMRYEQKCEKEVEELKKEKEAEKMKAEDKKKGIVYEQMKRERMNILSFTPHMDRDSFMGVSQVKPEARIVDKTILYNFWKSVPVEGRSGGFYLYYQGSEKCALKFEERNRPPKLDTIKDDIENFQWKVEIKYERGNCFGVFRNVKNPDICLVDCMGSDNTIVELLGLNKVVSGAAVKKMKKKVKEIEENWKGIWDSFKKKKKKDLEEEGEGEVEEEEEEDVTVDEIGLICGSFNELEKNKKVSNCLWIVRKRERKWF